MYYSDLHRLDPRSLEWATVAASGAADAPAMPRLFFSVAAAGDRLYVLGGTGDTQASNAQAAPQPARTATRSVTCPR